MNSGQLISSEAIEEAIKEIFGNLVERGQVRGKITMIPAGSSALYFDDGLIEVEHPGLIEWLLTIVRARSYTDGVGIILRIFEDEVYETIENLVTGEPLDIPYKTVYGWRFQNGEFYPLSDAEMSDAHNHDAQTGELIAPEPGVRYGNAWPLDI